MTKIFQIPRQITAQTKTAPCRWFVRRWGKRPNSNWDVSSWTKTAQTRIPKFVSSTFTYGTAQKSVWSRRSGCPLWKSRSDDFNGTGRRLIFKRFNNFLTFISDEQHIISPDSIEICRELGRGEFGICYQGTWTLPHGDAIQVAIKRVPPEKLKSNPMSFLQEAGVMTRMRHENVIRMYGVVLDTKSVMLVSLT